MGPRLAAAAPSTKATFPGYGHYRVLGTAGVGLGQTGEDGQVGHGGRERERTGGSRWASGAGRNGSRLGRPERWGRRHGNKKNIYEYVGMACVSVHDFIQREFRAKERSWHGRFVRSVSERTTSGTVRTGDWNPPCAECPRPIWTWAYFSKQNSQNVFIRVSQVVIRS